MKANDAVVWWVIGDECGVELAEDFERRDFRGRQDFRWMPVRKALGTGGLLPFGKKDVVFKLSLFVLFNTLVVRDRIDPQAVHRSFLAIEEYRRTISPDMTGAEFGE